VGLDRWEAKTLGTKTKMALPVHPTGGNKANQEGKVGGTTHRGLWNIDCSGADPAVVDRAEVPHSERNGDRHVPTIFWLGVYYRPELFGRFAAKIVWSGIIMGDPAILRAMPVLRVLLAGRRCAT
jgi:hypothetical protein